MASSVYSRKFIWGGAWVCGLVDRGVFGGETNLLFVVRQAYAGGWGGRMFCTQFIFGNTKNKPMKKTSNPNNNSASVAHHAGSATVWPFWEWRKMYPVACTH